MTTDYGYVLPVVVDPPETICFQIHVPKDIFHLAAFMGQMQELTRWYNWARDDAHTGKDVAAVWKRIYEEIRKSGCPDCPPLPHGVEQEDFMPLRVDCDCNVWVTCCDGTEMQLASLKDVQKPSQPGPQPQPKPGECSELDATIQANNSLFLPFAVGGGDVITVTDLTGGWYDGSIDTWRCPTGVEYLFGSCGGDLSVIYRVDDPLHTVPHMALIAKDSAGNYYDARSSFTINSALPDRSSLTFFANDSDTSNNAGSASFHVKICKNTQPVAFYYGLFTNFYAVEHLPSQIVWTPIELGVPTTITSDVPADPSHPDNLRAYLIVSYASSFDSTNNFQNPGHVWFKLTAISVSGATFDGGVPYEYAFGSGCSGTGTDSGPTGTLPTPPQNLLAISVTSHTQFVATITIEACS